MKKILLGIAMLMLVCGCGAKEKAVKNISDYETVCNNNKYVTTNVTSDYRNDSYIKEAMRCTSDKDEIEMIIYDSSENAKKVQDKQIQAFQTLKSTGNIIKKEEGKNYYKYTMISNGYYMVNSRVENTLIFTKVALAKKDNIDKIFSEMGY